ncbi:MAG: hypothetical protein LBP30_04365 [Clostridiales Family XIII bacterium]|jgi:hypothetical protein|nr:hypothetical protein [Clostridiales Family XIII bacterium]
MLLTITYASASGEAHELGYPLYKNPHTEAYLRYCWDVRGIEDYRVAPFHIRAN